MLGPLNATLSVIEFGQLVHARRLPNRLLTAEPASSA
jgi:hypothetical protein